MTGDKIDRLEANLAALAERQPDVARVIREASLPAGVVAATGRDGRPTFRVPNETGRLGWFGRSSMPTVSAPELVGGFRGDGRNAAMPGVMTGVEPLLVLAGMPAHSALFVLEADPVHLRLAFCLYDYSDPIRRGRLVFVFDRPFDLTEGFLSLFHRYPGYELPHSLLPVPTRTAHELGELQARIERAGEAVGSLQSELLAARHKRLQARSIPRTTERPRVAVLSVDPRPAALEHGRRIDATLRRMGVTHCLVLPDAPDRCHVLARMNVIAEVAAEMVLFLNGGGPAMAGLLPECLLVASWFLPGAVIAARQAQGGHEGWTVWASSRTQHDELLAAGVAAEAIRWAPPAAEDACAEAVRFACPAPSGDAVRMAVVVDLPDDRPEACGLTLPSHVRLWEALRSVAEETIDDYRPSCGPAWLSLAESLSGTELSEATLRERILTLLHTRLVPVRRAVADADQLARAGFGVEAWGTAWPRPQEGPEIRRGAVPVGEAWRSLLGSSTLIVLPDASAVSIQRAMDALAAGAATAVRNTLVRPFDEEYPGLESVRDHLGLYDDARELCAIAERVRRSQTTSDGSTRRSLVAGHLVSDRLRTMIHGTVSRNLEAAR